MESINTINRSLYINADNAPPVKRVVQEDKKPLAEDQSEAKKMVLKPGSAQIISDAEAIFSRADAFADLPSKVQKSLQAYEAVEISSQREALSQMMGVDLYA